MRDPRLALALLALFALAAGAALTTGCGSSSSSDPDPEPEPEFTHAAYFAENPYSGTNLNTACVECHTEAAGDILNTAHWLWEGTDNKIEGYTATAHGKTDLLNNFCIAIATNEGRCTQCHIGVGWKDDTFDFSNTAAIDCLVCHDTTGTYAKDPKTAGAPVASITDADWLAIGSAVGSPRRNNCGACHYKAGGGDNVKHGDLAVNLNSTTREYDVHMGTDGGNFTCQRCHEADADHGIGGMPIHHVDEGNMRQCADCHSGANAPDHSGVAAFSVGALQHGTLACQVCHIPTFARHSATKTSWLWELAGDASREPVIDPVTGKPDYDKMKGEFIWELDVRPTLLRHDGMWKRMMVGVNDTFTPGDLVDGRVVLAAPAAAPDSDNMIYTFKKMVGNQAADSTYLRIFAPHLFSGFNGPNPYWGIPEVYPGYDWGPAIQDAEDYLGLLDDYFSGSFNFVDTVMYLTVNHEVAPKEDAYNACSDCHGSGQIDWTALGYLSDPLP